MTAETAAATHTSEPWTLCTYGADEHRFPHVHFGPRDGACADPPEMFDYPGGARVVSGNYITINVGPSFQVGSTMEQLDATARLIAAAPDLLAVARMVTEMITAEDTGLSELADAARAAIKQIT